MSRWNFQSSTIGSLIHKVKSTTPADTLSYESWIDSLEFLLLFAEERPEYITSFLTNYFLTEFNEVIEF